MGEAIADAARGIKGAIQFIEIEEADAIVKRIPALESIEIEQGAFGGRPPRPAESFNTLGYSIRLVTNTRTDTDSIAELARQLFLIRQNLSAAIPGAGLMETPDVEEASAFLIHPGVRAYVNGEQRTWFDKYNDYIYLGLFLGSGLGSVAAGMFGWMRSGKRQARPQVPRAADRGGVRRGARCQDARATRCGRARGGRDFPFGVRAGRRGETVRRRASRASIWRWANCAAGSRRGAAALRTG